MLVIVGHGPSVVGKGLGPWLDEQTVVRLKWAEQWAAADWGTRTDFLCASGPAFWRKRHKQPGVKAMPIGEHVEFWFLSEERRETPKGTRQASRRWVDYYLSFNPHRRKSSVTPKASTGLKAVFCAMEFLAPAEIGLLGFDRILHPEVKTTKWWHEPGKYVYAHEAEAEHRALMDLDVKITEL